MKDFITVFRNVFCGSSYNPNKKSAARIAKQRTFGGISNRLFKKRECDGKQNRKLRVFFLIIIGVVGIAAGCLILFFDPYDIIFKFKIKLNAGGEFFELWKTPPVELYLRVFIFNVTNRDEFLAGKAKLKVEEIGPYVYREYMEHSNITFNSNGTMTSIPRHPLKWVPEMSNGTEEDLVIVPNVALLSFANVIMQSFSVTRMAANLVIHTTDSHPLVQMTAKEFMFGYQSNLVKIGNTLLPSWIKFDKVGLIDRMYDFDGDTSTFYTGEKNLALSGLIATYNRSPKLPQWDMPCGVVKDSSDGTKFQSLIKDNDTLLFFRKSLCRAMPMIRVGNETYRSGLKGYEYHFVENALDNGVFNEENKCFCRKKKCLLRGLIDVTDCYYVFELPIILLGGLSVATLGEFVRGPVQYYPHQEKCQFDFKAQGAERGGCANVNLVQLSLALALASSCVFLFVGVPIALSYPHFYESDPATLDKVDGCNPQAEKHESYFVIQPETGLPLEVAVRMQINMALENIGRISRVEKFANMVLPLLWTEIRMYGLPPNLSQLFAMYINILPWVQEIAIYLLFTGGAAFVLIAIIKLFRTSPVEDLDNLNAKCPQQKITAGDIFEMDKKTKSPLFSSKDVISEIIDEGKQAIFGKKQHKMKYESVYKDTVRRRSSLTNIFSFLARRDDSSPAGKMGKYDLKKSKDNRKESMPLRPSTDSETDSSTDKSKKSDPFQGEENINFSYAEEALKRTLIEERRKSKNLEKEESEGNDDFEIDVSMLDSIKEERI